MVKKYSQVFLTFLFLGDIFIVSASWVLSYVLRFQAPLIPVYKDIPPFDIYFSVTIFALVIWPITMKAFGSASLTMLFKILISERVSTQ